MRALAPSDKDSRKSMWKTPSQTEEPTESSFSQLKDSKITLVELLCTRKPSTRAPRMEKISASFSLQRTSSLVSRSIKVSWSLVELKTRVLLKVLTVLEKDARSSMRKDADLPNGEQF